MSDAYDPFGGPRPTGPPGAEGWGPPAEPTPPPPPAPPGAAPGPAPGPPPAPWATPSPWSEGAPAGAPGGAWPPAPGGPPSGGYPPAPGPYPGSGYGYGAPAHAPPPPGAIVRPQSMAIAVALMYVGAALSVLGGLAGFAMRDELRDEVETELARQGSTELDADTFVQILLIAGVVGAVIGATLWLVNAYYCGQGRPWSRILGSVFYGFSLLSSLFSLSQPAPALSRVVGVVSFLVATAAAILLWVPTSNRFFAEKEAARRSRRW